MLSIDFLKSAQIAMEADDITIDTQRELQNQIGETNSVDNRDERPQEDLTKTDDIFGTQTPEENDTGNENNPIENTTDTNTQNQDDEAATNDQQTDENTDQNLNSADDATPEENNQNDLLFTDKNKIKKYLTQLYKIISGNISVITDVITTIDDRETISVVNNVLENLRNCKEIIYTILTEELTKLSYDELLQKYITLKRVYSISVEMLERHFSINEKKNK